jgi:hypothetical protein
MAHSHPPFSIIILLFFLIAGTFFVGTLQTFNPTRAAMNLIALQDDTIAPPTDGASESHPDMTILISSYQTGEETLEPTMALTATPLASAVPDMGYAGTTGIFALGILVVLVILVGLVWGSRSPQARQG